MSEIRKRKAGRPPGTGTKGGLRNFRLVSKADDFLVKEAERTGRDMTQLMEVLLIHFSKLKPTARDAEIASILPELNEAA